MAFLHFFGKNIWASVSVLKHALVICKTHRNWKLLPQILKFFGTSHFSQNNNRERISVLLKTETFSCDIFVKMGCPEILWDLQILHKNIIEGTLLSLLQKSAPSLLDLCEKLTPQLEFWRSSFSTKRQPKECASFCAPFLLNLMEKDWVQNTIRKLLFGN